MNPLFSRNCISIRTFEKRYQKLIAPLQSEVPDFYPHAHRYAYRIVLALCALLSIILGPSYLGVMYFCLIQEGEILPLTGLVLGGIALYFMFELIDCTRQGDFKQTIKNFQYHLSKNLLKVFNKPTNTFYSDELMRLPFCEDLFSYPVIREALHQWMTDTGYLGAREIYLLECFWLDFQLLRMQLQNNTELSNEERNAFLNRFQPHYTATSALDHWESIQYVAQTLRDQRLLKLQTQPNSNNLPMRRL